MIKEIINELESKEVSIYLENNEIVLESENEIDFSIIDKIKKNKPLLVNFLNKIDEKQEYDSIDVVAVDMDYPISYAQRRLWILNQFDGGDVVSNLYGKIELEGEYDLDCFERAIHSVIDRHEILRTVFVENDNGEIRQEVKSTEESNFELIYRDFYNDQESLELYIKNDSLKAFNLTKGPLIRAAILKLNSELNIFYFNMHHIISDGWSMEVLSKDVLGYYEAYRFNKKLSLKELSIQYKDYTLWQLNQIENQNNNNSINYWRDILSGDIPVLNLSENKIRPKVMTHSGDWLGTYIDKDLLAKIKRYSQTNGGSVFTVLLAVLNVLLHKYTSGRDIIIGTSVTGRDHVDLKDQIGFYVNALALRNKIDPEETFDSFYSRLRENTFGAYNHQMYPFDKLVEDLKIKKDLSRNILFDTMLILQNNRDHKIDIKLNQEDINSFVHVKNTGSKLDLELVFEELGEFLSFKLIYNTDIFDASFIKQLMTNYKVLMLKILNEPNDSIKQYRYQQEFVKSLKKKNIQRLRNL